MTATPLLQGDTSLDPPNAKRLPDLAGGVALYASDLPVAYPDAVAFMDRRTAAIVNGSAAEAIWLLEHPPLITAGTSARDGDLRSPGRFPVYKSGRGGQYTYHGLGQRVVYVMLDLRGRGRDVRHYVRQLEAWIIATLGDFNIVGERRSGRVGIWVDRSGPSGPERPKREDKIAAIGVRLRRWVTLHGFAVNVDPDLSHFQAIVPCGINTTFEGVVTGVTSLIDLGLLVSLSDLDTRLIAQFAGAFPAAA